MDGLFDDLVPQQSKPSNGLFDDLLPKKKEYSLLDDVKNSYGTQLNSAIAGGENAARGILQGAAAIPELVAWLPDSVKEKMQEGLFTASDALRADQDARQKVESEKDQTLLHKASNLAGGLAPVLGTGGIAIAGGAGALGQDVLQNNGSVEDAQKATGIAGAFNTLSAGAGVLGKTKLDAAIYQGLLSPALGAAQQGKLNEVLPDKMQQNPLDVEARLGDAIVGSVLGHVMGGKAEEPRVIETGDPDIDAGQRAAVDIAKASRPSVEEVTKKRDSYVPPEPKAETTDLFGQPEAIGLDMFSKEPVPASTIEARRAAASDPTNPQRTEAQIAELEKNYLLDQQEKLNQLNLSTGEVTAQRGAIPDPFLSIPNQELPGLNQRKIFTREGEPVGVEDQSPNTAMQRAMLEGLAKRGQLRNESTPVEPVARPTDEVFQPSRVPEVQQDAFQRQLDLPNQVEQTKLFDDLTPKPAPESAPAKPETKKAVNERVVQSKSAFIEEVDKANKESLDKTGKPISEKEVEAIRTKFNNERPAFDLEQHQAIKQELEKSGTEAFETEGHTLPDELHTDHEGVKQEIMSSFGKDAPALQKALDNGKIRIIDSSELPERIQKIAQDNPDFRPRGYFSKDGTVTLVANNIRKGSVRELIFHEVGGHGGLQQLANKGKLAERIMELAKQGNADAKSAISKAALQKRLLKLPTEQAQHELLAYFVQHMSNRVQSPKGALGRGLSIYNELKAQIKNYLNEKYGLNITKLTDKDMYHLANGAIKRFSESNIQDQSSKPSFSVDQNEEKPATGKPAQQVTKAGRLLRNAFSSYGVNHEVGRIILDSSESSGKAQRLIQVNNKQFRKSGLLKADTDLVNRALDGDGSAITKLTPAQQEAIKSFRSDVRELQLQLAAEHPHLDGVDLAPMLYDSILKGNYNTIAYGAYTRKPDAGYLIRKALGGAKEPYWIDHLAKRDPQVLQNFQDFVTKNIAIPEVKNLTDTEVKELAGWWNVDGNTVEDLRKQLQEKRQAYGLDMETQTRQIMRDFVENKENTSIKVVKQVARNPGILKERVDMPKPMRDFLGEERDPSLRMAYTLSRLGDLLAKQNALGRMAALGEGKFFFKGETSPEGYNVKVPENDDYGAIKGMYTSKAILDQIKTLVAVRMDDPKAAVAELGQHALDFTGRNITGPAKLFATVGSHATGLVNFYSNLIGMTRNTTANLIMGNVKGLASPVTSNITAFRDNFNMLPKEKLARYAELGLTGDSAHFGELKDVESSVKFREAMQHGTALQKVAAVAGKAYQTPIQIAAKVYNTPDVALRIDTYEMHLAALKKVHPNKSQAEIERIAADKAKDETPTFSRATPIVKGVSKVMGNFATWSSEVIRTTANQGVNAIDDITQGYKTNNPQQVRYGFAQLAGTASFVTAARVLTPAIVSTFFGLAKKEFSEKDKDNLSELAPTFYKGNELQLVESDPKTHKALFVNSSRFDPANPYNEAFNRIRDHLKNEKVEDVWKVPLEFVQDNFLNWGPMPQALYQAARNKDAFDQPLPQEVKYGPVMVPGRVAPIANALTPGSVKNYQQIQKLEKGGAPDSVVKAKFLGAPLYELDAEKSVKSKLYDFRKQVTEAQESFKKSFGASDTKYSDEELTTLYKDYLAKEKDLFEHTHRAVQSGKETFGIKNNQIQELLSEASVPKDYHLGLISNRFEPKIWSTDEFLQKAQQKAIENDKADAAEIRKDFQHRTQLLNRLRRNWKEFQ